MRIAAILLLLVLALPVQAGDTPLGALRFRDYTVVMSSREGETLYTVLGRDGELLDEDLRLQEVQARHPELHGQLEGAVAGSGYLWAGGATDVFSGALPAASPPRGASERPQ